jgi:tripartite-type tricarboxylate transporter receptor subunit TctC
VQALAQEDLRNNFLSNGLTPVGSSGEVLAARVAADSAKWKKVIATLPSHAGK